MNKEEITKEDILNVTGSMFDTMLDYVGNSNKELEQLQQENKQLKDNWNKLKENWESQQEKYQYYKDNRYRRFLNENLEIMQELEKGDK